MSFSGMDEKTICEDEIMYPQVTFFIDSQSFSVFFALKSINANEGKHMNHLLFFWPKCRDSFRGKIMPDVDGMRCLSEKVPRELIEHPQMSPVHEEVCMYSSFPKTCT